MLSRNMGECTHNENLLFNQIILVICEEHIFLKYEL